MYLEVEESERRKVREGEVTVEAEVSGCDVRTLLSLLAWRNGRMGLVWRKGNGTRR